MVCICGSIRRVNMEFNINSVWIIIGACMLMILVSVISQMRNDLKHIRITLDKIAKKFGAIEIVTKEEKRGVNEVVLRRKEC